jgi:nucleotide-binding universal stress UspA family protein
MANEMRRDGKAYAVVVGFDFEPTGESAFNEALRFAAARGDVVIHAVHVIPERHTFWTQSSVEAYNDRLSAVPGLLRDHIRERWSHVPEVVARGLKLHVRVGDPAQGLLQAAVDYDAELIIVGTHGRTGVERFAVGSVAMALLETARCPVLVARARDFSHMRPSESPEPLCPDCARVRAASRGEALWCAWHARPEASSPVYGYSERYAQSSGAVEPVKAVTSRGA